MSEASNNVGTKKKSKKRRKGKNVGKGSGGTPKLPEECATDMPKVSGFLKRYSNIAFYRNIPITCLDMYLVDGLQNNVQLLGYHLMVQ